MKRIGIIGAMVEEIAPLYANLQRERTEEYANIQVHIGEYSDYEIYALQCGIGKVNATIAAQMIIDRFAPDLIVMVGVCGAIDRLKIGDTIISTKVAHHDFDPSMLVNNRPYLNTESGFFMSDYDIVERVRDFVEKQDYSHGVHFGAMVSGEQFIDKEGRQTIIDRFSPLCVDMETSGIAHACFANGVPFFSMKSVTDTEEEHGAQAFEINYELARTNSLKVLDDILKGKVL